MISSTSDSALVRLQRAVAALLRDDPMFTTRPVITEDVQDIEGELDKALAPLDSSKGTIGTAAVVMTALGQVGSPNTPGPILDPVGVHVWIFENVVINRATGGGGVSALELAERAMRHLHLRKVPLEGCGALVARGMRIEEPPESLKSCLAFHVEFRTKVGLAPITTGR